MPAGTYHFVLDCIVTDSVDVDFDMLWRRGTDDVVLSSWSQHFDRTSVVHEAQAYEVDEEAPAVQFAPGDQLVFRASARNTTSTDAWIPNGDGALSKGRIPNITLPH